MATIALAFYFGFILMGVLRCMSDQNQPDPISTSPVLRLLAACRGNVWLWLSAGADCMTSFAKSPVSAAAQMQTPVTLRRADESREIQLEFVTTVNQYAPWEFQPDADSMTVHPGGMYDATFYATNLTDKHKIAQAVPSVAPQQAAAYFKKMECFCFQRRNSAGEEKRNAGALHRRLGPAGLRRHHYLSTRSSIPPGYGQSRWIIRNIDSSNRTTMAHAEDRYYVPHGSHWPVVGSAGLFFLMVGVSVWLNGADTGFWVMMTGARDRHFHVDRLVWRSHWRK